MYDELVGLFLKRIRGEHDCMSMSKKMGYSYNQYFKLENGYKKLTFDDFIKVCNLKEDYDLEDIFKSELNIKPESLTQKDIVNSYCDVWGDPSRVILTREMKFSTSKWWRIKNNKTKLFFSDFLNLLDNTGGDVFSFLSQFLGTKNIGDGKYDKSFHDNENEFLCENPDAAFIMVALSTKEYLESSSNNDLDIIQKISQVDKERFLFLFHRLMEIGIIEFDKNLKKYRRTKFKTETRTDKTYETSKQLFLHCVSRQAEYLKDEHDQKRVCFGMKVMPVSPNAYEQIKSQLLDCYSNISNIIENDSDEADREMAFFQFGSMILPQLEE